MAQGVTIDISARVTGYEQSLQQLRNALAKLNPGTEISNNITKALQTAESKVKTLSQNLTPKVTNDSQLDRLVTKVNSTGEAILNVSKLMKNITTDDVNFSAIGNEVGTLTQQIKALESELQSNVSRGFSDFINNSDELRQKLKGLDIDPKDMSIGQVFEVLQKKAAEAATQTEQAAKRVSQAQQNLTKKENSLNALQKNPIYNKETIENELQGMSAVYTNALNNVKTQVEQNLSSFGLDTGKQQKFLEAFTGGLSKDNLAQHIQELMASIRTELESAGKSMSANDVLTRLFPDASLGGSKNGQAAANVLGKLFPDVNQLKAEWQAKLQTISTELTTAQVGNVQELISKGEIDKASERTIEYIESAYRKIAAKETQLKQEVINAQNAFNTAQTDLNAAKAQETTVQGTSDALAAKVRELTEKYASLQSQIDDFRKQLEGTKKEQIVPLQNAGSSAKDFLMASKEVEEYNKQLDQVKQREQMVGKVEGLVNRWFSIYSVVRMVSNAIKSMIATVKELDKTITNIAIVTNMSQDDLWGQMPTYTAMAREYAVSISGVYEVSQLFYQQGTSNI